MTVALHLALRAVTVTLVVTLQVASSARADSPAPPRAYEVDTANGEYTFVMNPGGRAGTGYRKSGLYPSQGGDPLWTVDWYAFGVHLSRDGRYLIRMGPWAWSFDDLAIAFYDRGKLINAYAIRELVPDENAISRTVSHFFWQSGAEFDEHGNVFTLSTYKDDFRFDVTTGEIVAASTLVPTVTPAVIETTDGQTLRASSVSNCLQTGRLIMGFSRRPHAVFLEFADGRSPRSEGGAMGEMLVIPFPAMTRIKAVSRGESPVWDIELRDGQRHRVYVEDALFALCHGNADGAGKPAHIPSAEVEEIVFGPSAGGGHRTTARRPNGRDKVLAGRTVASVDRGRFQAALKAGRLVDARKLLAPVDVRITRGGVAQFETPSSVLRESIVELARRLDEAKRTEGRLLMRFVQVMQSRPPFLRDRTRILESLLAGLRHAVSEADDTATTASLRKRIVAAIAREEEVAAAWEAITRLRLAAAGRLIEALLASDGRDPQVVAVARALEVERTRAQHALGGNREVCGFPMPDEPVTMLAAARPHDSGARHRSNVLVVSEAEPIVLVLSASVQGEWSVQTSRGTRIAAVVVGALAPQTVKGLDEGIPVHTYDRNHPDGCRPLRLTDRVDVLADGLRQLWMMSGRDLSGITFESADGRYLVTPPGANEDSPSTLDWTGRSIEEVAVSPLPAGEGGLDALVAAGGLTVADEHVLAAWSRETARAFRHLNPALEMASLAPRERAYIVSAKTALPPGIPDPRTVFIVPRGVPVPELPRGGHEYHIAEVEAARESRYQSAR